MPFSNLYYLLSSRCSRTGYFYCVVVYITILKNLSSILFRLPGFFYPSFLRLIVIGQRRETHGIHPNPADLPGLMSNRYCHFLPLRAVGDFFLRLFHWQEPWRRRFSYLVTIQPRTFFCGLNSILSLLLTIIACLLFDFPYGADRIAPEGIIIHKQQAELSMGLARINGSA